MADTGIFAWLDRAESCGDRDVERAALVMKDYYQGVGPEPEYAEQAIASRPAEVDDEWLPPLPPSDPELVRRFGPPTYTVEQYRQGQRDAVAADRAQREKLPANAAEMIAFIGSHYHFMRDMADPNDTVYELTVHDLLSAFRWWFDDYELEDEPSHTTNKEK